MKALVVGYGSIGKRHCRLLQATGLPVENIFVSELQPSRKADAQDAGHSLFQLGDNASFDIAVVASSTSSHISILNQLPTVHKLIYIEKPLSHDYLQVAPVARRLHKSSSTCKIVVGYMLRHHPAVQKVKSIIESGALGKALRYHAECGMYLPNWHPWEDYRDFYMSDIDGGGGALLDISHEIDLISYLVGDTAAVFGKLGNLSDLECSSDDFSQMMLFHKNGATGTISLDLIQKDTYRKTRIVFDKGEIEIDFVNKTLSIHTGVKRG